MLRIHKMRFFYLNTCPFVITPWPPPATHLMQGSCHHVLTCTALKPSHETLMPLYSHTPSRSPTPL
jgi:hypothetical protein